MNSMNDNFLFNLLQDLYSVLEPNKELTSDLLSLFKENIIDNELEDNRSLPDWLKSILIDVKDKNYSEKWIDFYRSSDIDDSNVMDFIRELQFLLPVDYKNNEESWLLTFEKINIELCISLEGSCYKISKTGQTWE